ncbi:hypothetical protein A2U01_0060808, partial [Trifolium medium]|nr:hypothetical protein [Trifolium medium]
VDSLPSISFLCLNWRESVRVIFERGLVRGADILG